MNYVNKNVFILDIKIKINNKQVTIFTNQQK